MGGARDSVKATKVDSFVKLLFLFDDKFDNVYYFPSFEIVMDCVGPTAFKEDLRHVRPEVFSEIIAPQFLESFGDF